MKIAILRALCGVVLTGLPAVAQDRAPSVDFTWLAVTNWLVEAGDTRILLNGAITRFPVRRFDPNDPETLLTPPVPADTGAVRRAAEALGIDRLDYVVAGHAHADHTFDTAAWLRMTDAQLIGSRTTCLQALAQGIPPSRCTVVQGGEVVELTPNLHVRVVAWHHSGSPTDSIGVILQMPLELIDPPTPEPASGALRPSGVQDFPNGSAKAYLFTYEEGGRVLRWFFSDTGNAATFDEPGPTDPARFRDRGFTLDNLRVTPDPVPVGEHLRAAVRAEGIDDVDLWLGYVSAAHVADVSAILRPRAYIPHHWGGQTPLFRGLQRPLSEAVRGRLREAFEGAVLVQEQYADRFRLTPDGVVRVDNGGVKRALGIPEAGR